MYTTTAMLVVLAEVALVRTLGTMLLLAGLVALAAAIRALAARQNRLQVAGGALEMSDQGEPARANLAGLAVGMLCVAAGIALWAR